MHFGSANIAVVGLLAGRGPQGLALVHGVSTAEMIINVEALGFSLKHLDYCPLGNLTP